MNKKIIWLFIISVIVLCTAVGWLAWKLWQSLENLPPRTGPFVTTTNPDDENFYLNDFRQVSGTPYFISEVTYHGPGWGSARFYEFSYSNSQVRNLVFLDSATLDSHTLFPSYEQAVLDTLQFPQGYSYEEREAPVQWLVYQVVERDTNEDGELSLEDEFIIAVSSPDGRDYTVLLQGLDGLYGVQMPDNDRLLVVYSQNSQKSASTVDLTTKTILQTQPLVELGIEVK